MNSIPYCGKKTLETGRRSTTIVDLGPRSVERRGVGRPAYAILGPWDGTGACFSKDPVSRPKVSRWTIYRRVNENNLDSLSRWSNISDEELDGILRSYMNRHGRLTGESYLIVWVFAYNVIE